MEGGLAWFDPDVRLVFVKFPRLSPPVLSLPYQVQQYDKFCPLLPNWGSAAGPLGHPFPDQVGLPMASVVWLVQVRTRL